MVVWICDIPRALLSAAFAALRNISERWRCSCGGRAWFFKNVVE
jgi:hypothetical protein